MKNIYILIILSFLSCKSKEEKALIRMKSVYEKWITDEAFKQNIKLTIYQLDAISIDTVNENTLDSLQRAIYQNKVNQFILLGNEEVKRAEKHTRLSKLGYQLNNDLGTQAKELANENMKLINSYIDSSKYYLKLDSILNQKILSRKQPVEIYKAKFFLKSTFAKDGQERNSLDTVFGYFNSDFKQLTFALE